jgi:hypothetical protein
VDDDDYSGNRDDDDDNNNNSIQFNSIQFWFISVPNQQPDGQLQKQHNKQTQITMDNKQDKNKTNTTKQISKQTITCLNN